MQDESTADMIFDVATLVSYASTLVHAPPRRSRAHGLAGRQRHAPPQVPHRRRRHGGGHHRPRPQRNRCVRGGQPAREGGPRHRRGPWDRPRVRRASGPGRLPGPHRRPRRRRGGRRRIDGAQALEVDLADAPQTRELAASILADPGRCDVLVNNAAHLGRHAFEELDLDTWRRFHAVNVEAPFLLCSALVPAMAQRGGGRVVNIVSNTVWAPPPPACAPTSPPRARCWASPARWRWSSAAAG